MVFQLRDTDGPILRDCSIIAKQVLFELKNFLSRTAQMANDSASPESKTGEDQQ